MFGRPSVYKEYAAVIRQLEQGERRPARHVRPVTVTDSGFESFATPAVQAVFEEFEYFAAVLNQHASDPWTVEETGETLIKDYNMDSPRLGRTYQVFFNGVRLGSLQVTDGFNPAGGLREEVDWHRQNRAAQVLAKLDYLQFVPYDDAFSFIHNVEWFVGRFDDYEASRFRAKAEATAALTGYLWEVQRADCQYVPSFDHTATGPYDLLKRTSDDWKEGGVDPFKRWGGDRPS